MRLLLIWLSAKALETILLLALIVAVVFSIPLNEISGFSGVSGLEIADSLPLSLLAGPIFLLKAASLAILAFYLFSFYGLAQIALGLAIRFKNPLTHAGLCVLAFLASLWLAVVYPVISPAFAHREIIAALNLYDGITARALVLAMAVIFAIAYFSRSIEQHLLGTKYAPTEVEDFKDGAKQLGAWCCVRAKDLYVIFIFFAAYMFVNLRSIAGNGESLWDINIPTMKLIFEYGIRTPMNYYATLSVLALSIIWRTRCRPALMLGTFVILLPVWALHHNMAHIATSELLSRPAYGTPYEMANSMLAPLDLSFHAARSSTAFGVTTGLVEADLSAQNAMPQVFHSMALALAGLMTLSGFWLAFWLSGTLLSYRQHRNCRKRDQLSPEPAPA